MEIIVEIGQNHNGDISLAKEMIKEVKRCGANVAKFQLYDAKALFPKEGNEWFDYNCKTELSHSDMMSLLECCENEGIEFMASAFDLERVSWLERAGVKRHKIASRSIYDRSLLDAVMATNKPVLVSLGHWKDASFPEIKGSQRIDYLYCISKYPTLKTDVHLRNVDFSKYAGFSDHTIGISAPMAALARGARIIEKHFTLDKNAYGPDHSCSMTPVELRAIVEFKNDLEEILA